MNLETIKSKLQSRSIYYSQDKIQEKSSVIGYEKKFKWSWMATQMNTFIVASNFENEEINQAVIERHLNGSFNYAKQNYKGWPRGFQSGLGVISILISGNVDVGAKEYCLKLKSGKKWAGFAIPVVIDSETGRAFYFEKNPIWGRVYYPHFKKIIKDLTS